MDMSAYIDELKLALSGNLLDLELDDSVFVSVINSSLREVQRYIGTTALITVPYSSCIDCKPYKISSVYNIFRASGYLSGDDGQGASSIQDPMYVAQWQMLSGNGGIFGINKFSTNYAVWNSALQIRNTISTDLSYRYDKPSEKLYINCAFDIPTAITIEYIPRFDDVNQITSDYWIDIIQRMSIAKAKMALGRVRTRFNSPNAPWQQDGETILAEGREELTELRTYLQENSMLSQAFD